MKKCNQCHRLLLSAIFSLLASSLASAENLSVATQKTKSIENTVLLNTIISDQKLHVQNNHTAHTIFTEITQTNFEKLSSTEQKTLASQWGLSTNDYARYLQLMEETPNGLYYRDQHLDPSWILGINAQNAEERRKYVTLAVLHERERMAKLLLFQQTFDRLQQELFPGDKPIQFLEKETHLGATIPCRQN
jgi:hypothetical protein